VIPSLGIGGTEKVLLQICQGLDRALFQPFVCALKSGGPTAEALSKISVPVQVFGSAPGFWKGALDSARLCIQLKKTILETAPDIVHTWLSRANVLGRLAAKSADVSTVISSLRVMEKEKNYHLWAERLTHPWCKIVTVNSTPLRTFAIKDIGIPEKKIVLIYNGIEIPPFTQKMLPTKPDGTYLIGSLGRLHAQKGMDLLLHAAKIVLKKFPRCRFLIGGEGPEKENLEALARTLEIQSHVTFPGLIKDSKDFLSQLDLFVLASRWEGMPNVILEAMSLQKPVVSTRVGGAIDLIDDGQDGMLVPPEEPDACAKAILALLDDSNLRRRISEAAFEKVKQKFALGPMIRAYQSLYESILQKN